MRSLALAALGALAALACSSPPPAASPAGPEPAPEPQPAERQPLELQPEHLAPFSAAELRAGIPAGTELKLRIEAPGQLPVVQQWTFTEVDDRGCTIHARLMSVDGAVVRDEGSGTTTWAELESHAHFPPARTTRTESSVQVPAGTFETWLFEVEPETPSGQRKRLHFARSMPGPPIWMEVTAGGKRVLLMELVSRTAGAGS